MQHFNKFFFTSLAFGTHMSQHTQVHDEVTADLEVTMGYGHVEADLNEKDGDRIFTKVVEEKDKSDVIKVNRRIKQKVELADLEEESDDDITYYPPKGIG